MIATQNPVEMQGTFPLPEAQLDRFLLCLSLGYPEKEQELALLSRPAAVPESKPVATAAQLLAARQGAGTGDRFCRCAGISGGTGSRLP